MPVPREAKVFQFGHMTKKEMALRLIQLENSIKSCAKRIKDLKNQVRSISSDEEITRIWTILHSVTNILCRDGLEALSLRAELFL